MSPLQFNSPFESTTSKAVSKDDTKPTAGAGKSADDIEDLLNDDKDEDVKDKDESKLEDKDEEDLEPDITKDEDEDEDEDENKDEDNDEDEDDEKVKLKEDEDEDEEKEKLDLKDEEKNITAPPKVKEIEKKFPEFFKEFPFMKRMMFRDKAYTEMFGSFDEAKEVHNKVERLNEFETQLFNGDVRDVFSTLKDTNPKAFDKVVDTFLKQIAEVDKSAYDDITQNFAKQIVLGIADEAKRKKDEDLDKLAKSLYEWLFDKTEWEDFKVRVKPEKSEEENKVAKEREEFMRERFEIARDTLTVKVDNILKATIGEYIDPRGQMSTYEKKNATAETLKRVHEKVGQDGAFRKNLDRLWKASMNEKFSENSLNGIKKSYLGKAKTLLASVIKDVRTEVLKDNRSKGKEKTSGEEPSTRKTVNAGRPHQQTNKANERKPGETVEEFLARD